MTSPSFAEDSIFDVSGGYYEKIYDRTLVGHDFLKAGSKLSHFNNIEKAKYDALASIYFHTSQKIEDKTIYRNDVLTFINKSMEAHTLYKAVRDNDPASIAKEAGKAVVTDGIDGVVAALPLSLSDESSDFLSAQISSVANLVLYDVLAEPVVSKKLKAAYVAITDKIMFAGINLGGFLAELKAHSQYHSALLSIDFLEEFYRCNSSFECVRTRNFIKKSFFWDYWSQKNKEFYIISEYTIKQEENRGGKLVLLRAEFYDEIFKTINFIDSYIEGRYRVYLENTKPLPVEPSEPIVYALNIGRVGKGSVISTNSLILNCGSDCNGFVQENTDVVIEASASVGYFFKKWIGDCIEIENTCTVTMDKAHTIFAVFEANAPAVVRNISVKTLGGGNVNSISGIDCGSDCSQSFSNDLTVILKAIPEEDHYFSSWDDESCTGIGDCTVFVDSPKYIKAFFEPCVTIDHLWQKTGPLHAGAANNFDAQFKISNHCSSVQSYDNAVIALHHADTHAFYKTCYETGLLNVSANNYFDTGFQYCTVFDAGEYELIVKTNTVKNGWVNLAVQKVTFLPGNRPKTPSQPTASDGAYTDKVNISWVSVIGADSYKVYRCLTPSEIVGCIQIGTSLSTNYADSNGNSNIEYYYRIKASHITGGDSDFSSPDLGYKLALITFPPPPSAVTATDGNFIDKVTITWTNVAEANTYLVYRCNTLLVDSCHFIAEHEGMSFNDIGGLGGLTYYYRVKSVNNNGHSIEYSNFDSGFRNGISSTPVKPDKPIATDGTFTDRVNITWSEISGANSYRVYRCENSNVESCNLLATIVNVTNFDDVSSISGTTYYYRILASNGNGDSIVSDADTGFKFNSTSTPSIPGKPNASDGIYVDKVRITWLAVSGVNSYSVFRCSNTSEISCTTLITTTATNYDDTGILPGSTYFYRLKANGTSSSEYSSYDAGYLSASAPVPTTGAPSATDGEFLDKIVVSWQPVVGDDAIYQVYRCTTTATSSCIKQGNYSGTSMNDRDSDGVRRNTIYYYRIKTLSNTSISAFSNYNAGSLGNETATPQKPTASYGTYGDKIHVSWAKVTGATEYQLYACEVATNSPGSNSQCYLTHPGQELFNTEFEHTEQHTASGQHLFYHLRADNGFGNWTDFSLCCSVGFRSVSVPNTPASVSADDGANNDYINVSTSKVDGAKGYEFYRCWNENVDSCVLVISTIQDKSFFKDYDAGQATYYYRTKSIGYSGTSDFSDFDIGYKEKSTILQPTIIARLDSTSTDINQQSDDGSSFAKAIAKFGGFSLIGKSLDSNNTGSAYIYKRQENGTWKSITKLVASDGEAGDFFGYDVALSNEHAIVKTVVGKVYIFEHQSDNTWVELAILTATDGGSFSGKGTINLLGDRLLIGAKNDNSVGLNSGSVYILERQSNGSWTQMDKLVASDAGESDYFGGRLSQSQDKIVVGAPSKDSIVNGEESGAAYVFEFNKIMNKWFETIKLTASDAQGFMHFGDAVEISGDLLMITSRYFNTSDELYPPSYTDIFENLSDGSWHKKARLSAEDGTDNNGFGREMIIVNSENKVIIGAPYAYTSGKQTGAAYVFSKDIFGDWSQSNKFSPDDASLDIRNFSYSISIEGNELLFGAHSSVNYIDNFYKGSAYIYEIPSEPSINIVGKNGLTTSELGKSVSFGVTLNSKPTADVSMSLSVSDQNEGFLNTASLIFTSDNWFISQSVIITGINDNVLDGDKNYSVIISPASSLDNNYDGLDVTDVNVVNLEDGVPLAISMIGKGNVVSNPSSIDCISNCIVFLNKGMNISLTATPASGYEFSGWTSADCSGIGKCNLSMSQAHNLIANFRVIEKQLNISVFGSGKVISFPDGIDCRLDCSEKFIQGMQVILYAQPKTGYDFYNWGNECNTDNPCIINMDKINVINAQFIPYFDFDFDGMPGEWEIENGTNPLISDANIDIDNDGLTNLEEYNARRNPQLNESAIAIQSVIQLLNQRKKHPYYPVYLPSK